jgi:hypothetical protein
MSSRASSRWAAAAGNLAYRAGLTSPYPAPHQTSTSTSIIRRANP